LPGASLERVKLRVLGSSGGWPAPGRACSGYLVSDGDSRIWLDAGAGTLSELLRHMALAEVDALWISHLHPDHCSDLGLVRNAIAYGGARDGSPLRVLGPPRWLEWFDVAVPDSPATRRAFEAEELRDGGTFVVGDLRLRAFAVRHETATYACRVESEDAVLAYSADSAPCRSLVELARGADLFLCESFLSLPQSRSSDIVMTPEQAGSMASAAGARSLLLTHLHPDADPDAAVSRARTTYQGEVALATPGLHVSIGEHGG
jgi:ribonuclease BN (tRNA processing enzyme)